MRIRLIALLLPLALASSVRAEESANAKEIAKLKKEVAALKTDVALLKKMVLALTAKVEKAEEKKKNTSGFKAGKHSLSLDEAAQLNMLRAYCAAQTMYHRNDWEAIGDGPGKRGILEYCTKLNLLNTTKDGRGARQYDHHHVLPMRVDPRRTAPRP